MRLSLEIVAIGSEYTCSLEIVAISSDYVRFGCSWLRTGMFFFEIAENGTDYAQFSWNSYHVLLGIVANGSIYVCFS